MRKSFKQITASVVAIAVLTFVVGTTAAFAAVGNGGSGARGGDATEGYPAQDSCMQSPASTSYTPCWTNG